MSAAVRFRATTCITRFSPRARLKIVELFSEIFLRKPSQITETRCGISLALTPVTGLASDNAAFQAPFFHV